MTSVSTQHRLADLWWRFFAKEITRNDRVMSEDALRALIEELRAPVTFGEDAVVYTMALRLDGGTIAQLTRDADDPGFVNRAMGATEGFYPRDYCGAAERKRCGVASSVRTFEPAQFLARDQAGTLADRSRAFEEAFIALLQSKLAS